MDQNGPQKLGDGSEVNPLKSDFELQTLLKKLDKVTKYKTFQRWKSKFLDRLERYLYEKGIDPAEKACDAFALLLTKFVKSANGVVNYIEKGDLGNGRKTVKASLALNEMCSSLTKVVGEVEGLIPSRKQEEKKKGFSKFHLGAALIRQGFHQYAKMKAIEDVLTEIGAKLADVADRQQHELFESFKVQVQRFCDVMADLSLYEVMIKCIEFAEPPPEEESSDEEDILVEISVDTPEGTKTLKLEVDPFEKVGSIKDTIADTCGIPPEKQVLKFKGKELDDNGASLKSVGIENRSKLTAEPFKIPITVETYDGKKIEVLVDPSIYLSDLKRLIEDEAGVPAKKQSLFLNGRELDNDFLKAEDCGVKAGSKLYMEPKSIGISATMPDGSTHTFDVSVSDTPETIKTMIANETGMPATSQILNFNGKDLTDGKSLKELGVRDGSNLNVGILKVPVVVNTHDGKQIEVLVDPRSYLSDIKRQLEPETNVAANNQRLFMHDDELSDDNMKAIDYGIKAGSVLFMEPKSMAINVEMPDGKVISVDICPSETIQSVKDKIADCTGMIRRRQILKHGGKELSNATLVKKTGLKDGSTVKIEVFTVPVTVNTHDGKKIQVMADPTLKLIDFKKQLESESGLSPDNQNLFMNGDELSNDNMTLSEYGIGEGSELDLEPKSMSINVEFPDGKVISVDVSPSETIESVKGKIEDCTGMAPKRQILKLDNKDLSNKALVKTTGLKDGSTVKLEIFKVPVTVSTLDGKKIQVMADPTMKLIDFKKQLESESGISPDNQNLSMDGDVLSNDNKALFEYGIKEGSELDLEPKSMSINVEMPDGKVISVDISPSETVESVKDKIEGCTGMAPKRQILKHNKTELPNKTLVRKTGLKDGSTVKVEIFKIPVTVSTHDGKKIQVMVDPTKSVVDFKKQLERETGLSPENQKLSMDGDVLSNNTKSLAEYGVKEGSELDLEPMSVTIGVEMPDGKEYSIEISPLDKDEQIKSKIEAKTGMAPPRQVLKLNGVKLPSGKAAKDMGIQDGSNLKVEVFKIPVTVRSMDGGKAKVMVDPTQKLGNLKRQLEDEFDIPASNQNLSTEGKQLSDNSMTASDHGIKAGSELYLEPHVVNINVQMPDGQSHSVGISPSSTSSEIKAAIAAATGVAAPRQLLYFNGKDVQEGRAARDLGIKEGSSFTVDLFTIPVSVKTPDGQTHEFDVEPCASIDSLKKMVEKDTGIPPKKQCLKYNDDELNDGKRSVDACGVKSRSVLTLTLITDHIIFVDVKCGTLFAVEREIVIKNGVLSPHQNNKLDFLEAAKDSAAREKLLKVMLDSPSLGLATQVVVEKNVVDDYEMGEAEKVKSMWGVNLKKREKNKAGEEFIFVDPKTGASGELARKKYVDMGFITPVGGSIEEAEHDTMTYDKYITEMRNVFGVKLVS